MTDWVTDDDDALAALVNLIVVVADNKYYLGRRMSEWSVGPPTLEDSVAGAAIAQQLLGQARVLYPVLDELPATELGVPDTEGGRTRRYNISGLDEPWPTWPHAVAALFLANSACNVVLHALAESTYTELPKRVGRMLEDERLHAYYAAGRVRELVNRYEPGRRLLQERVDEAFTEVLCWFGPQDEPGVEALRSAGLIGPEASNEAWRQAWLERVGEVLEEVGVTFPAHRVEPRASRSGHDGWEYDELPWNRWNHLQRRLDQPTTTS